ncbi:MAG TPA: NAD(P)/FAD-dependent oxidoreductase [Bryobacteraceae bacterium]
MLQDFDFAIAGGGPAGSTAGMCLARSGWRVAIFEAGSFDREKPGETLPPEINPLLRELGVWESFQAQSPVECPGVVSAWGGRVDEVDYTYDPFGPGWHIDRRRFDEMLFNSASRAGASTYPRQRVNFVRENGGWRVERSAKPPVFARFVIDATGRNGIRIESNPVRIVDDVLLATILRTSISAAGKRDLRTLIEAAPSGWWYSACLPAGQIVAMFFTGRETFRREEDFIPGQLEHAPLTRARLQGAVAIGARAEVVSVSSSYREQIAGDGWLATGDSASSFDPLSGRGIFKAIRQSIAAAKAAEAALGGDAAALDDYAVTVQNEFDAYRTQRAIFYGAHALRVSHPFWKARAAVPMKV